jgi:hypothetical protein
VPLMCQTYKCAGAGYQGINVLMQGVLYIYIYINKYINIYIYRERDVCMRMHAHLYTCVCRQTHAHSMGSSLLAIQLLFTKILCYEVMIWHIFLHRE